MSLKKKWKLVDQESAPASAASLSVPHLMGNRNQRESNHDDAGFFYQRMLLFLRALLKSRSMKGNIDNLDLVRSVLYGSTLSLRYIWSFLRYVDLNDFIRLLYIKNVRRNPDLGLAATDPNITHMLSTSRLKVPVSKNKLPGWSETWAGSFRLVYNDSTDWIISRPKKALNALSALKADVKSTYKNGYRMSNPNGRVQRYLKECATAKIVPLTPLVFGWSYEDSDTGVAFSVPCTAKRGERPGPSAVALKSNSNRDCDLIFGDTALTSGVYFWEVYIAKSSDETWVGIANEKARQSLIQQRRQSTETMNTPGVVALYDCQRRYRHPALHNKSSPDPDNTYVHARGRFEHQTVGVLLDLDSRCMCFVVDGHVVARVAKTHMPTGPLYPVCHMDRDGDTYVLTRAFRVRSNVIRWSEQ